MVFEGLKKKMLVFLVFFCSFFSDFVCRSVLFGVVFEVLDCRRRYFLMFLLLRLQCDSVVVFGGLKSCLLCFEGYLFRIIFLALAF